MKKQALPVVLILIVMFIVGCTTLTGNLQKQSENLSHALARISPSTDRAHENVLVLLPSDVEILKHYLQFAVSLQLSDVEIQKNCISYLYDKKLLRDDWHIHNDTDYSNFSITVAKNNLQFVVDAIRKRGIFDSVSVAYQNGNPASFPIGEHDYLVFVDVDGWFIKGRNNPKPLAISFEKTKLPLEMLQQQAKALRTK